MSTFIQNLRFAVRGLRLAPGFSFAAIATLALGIGATTAIFSVVNAAILKPLPYADPDNLYAVRTALTDGRVTTGLVSPGELTRLNVPSVAIVGAAGVQPQQVTLLRDDGAPLVKTAYAVTEGFFEVFGSPMTLGGLRHENSQGDPNGNTPPVVVISTRIWRDLYSSDPNIIGKTVNFTQARARIVGVAPRGFDTPHDADFWVAFARDPMDVSHSFESYLRVKPGATIDQVRQQAGVVMQTLEKDYPASDKNRVYVMRPLVDQIVGDLGPILIVVLSATGLLLVLACVNVTNLMLARGAARAKEMAVRVSLGAGRGAIIRQLMTESIVLATAGAIVGLGVAYAGLQALLAAGASKFPRLETVSFDSHVLLFALGTMIVSGIVVGFAPAIRLAKTDLRSLMNESGRSASGGRATGRWLSGLTIAEIALAVTLVAGAGWLIRGFDNLRAVKPGFVGDGRLVFDVSFQGERYQNGQAVVAASDDLLRRIRGISSVVGAGTTTSLPLKGAQESSLLLQLKGEPFDEAHPMGTRQRIVSPGYFDAIGTRLIAGRDFNTDDRQTTQAVAIINKTFADRYLKGRNPIGVQFAAGYPTIDPRFQVEIIGVIEDVRQKTLSDAAEPAYYSSDLQIPARRRTLVVHTTAANLASIQTQVRDAVHAVDPQMPVDFDSLEALTAATLQRQQLGMMLMLVFGGAALALAAVGIYGVIAYAASQRTGEVATRLALGATPGSVFFLMLRQGRTLTLIGAAIGLAASYLSGRAVASRLYEVKAADPVVLAAATIAVIILALSATTIPAFRVSRTKPSRVLRGD